MDSTSPLRSGRGHTFPKILPVAAKPSLGGERREAGGEGRAEPQRPWPRRPTVTRPRPRATSHGFADRGRGCHESRFSALGSDGMTDNLRMQTFGLAS